MGVEHGCFHNADLSPDVYATSIQRYSRVELCQEPSTHRLHLKRSCVDVLSSLTLSTGDSNSVYAEELDCSMRMIVAPKTGICKTVDKDTERKCLHSSASGSSVLVICCINFFSSQCLVTGSDIVELTSDAPEDALSSERAGVGSWGLDGSKGVLLCDKIGLEGARRSSM